MRLDKKASAFSLQLNSEVGMILLYIQYIDFTGHRSLSRIKLGCFS